ncbi:acyltransferase [Microbacterium sp. ISL-103]|uniref:acyltransferase family protein n=1 Tax=Microbacterium sp. ISL-103 TaxID=2819156 RepID=UPI001BE8BA26|nr:acyltransferase [Microbacterium sp. ISL-103]MBT2475037.1 acyltransferase [Microbacterium sp. ISL-103]
MAIAYAPPLAAVRAPAAGGRDTAIDFLRALCVTGVVLLHAIMVGVTVVGDGPVFANASEGTWWIVPVSWALQVMPLFFMIGGFAGYLAFRRHQTRGGSAAGFIAARVHRLLRPSVVAIAVVGTALGALALAGVPAKVIVVAGFRHSQPLWFLAVFLGCQALLPALASAHARMPRTTLALLVLAAFAVDALRAQTGVEGLGFLNLAFVWLALQQIGFFLADGTIERLSRRVRAIAGASALLTLLATFATGVYSPDLIANINPPTTALLLVGIVHLSVVSLLRDRIEAFSRRPMPAAFGAFVNRRTMTIYLWHMPVLLAMAGISATASMATGVDLPEPSSLAWWVSRPLWLGTALALTAVTAVALTRAETAASPHAADSPRRVLASAVVGISAVVLLLVVGTTVLSAGLATAGALVALRLASGTRAPETPATAAVSVRPTPPHGRAEVRG